MRWAGCLFLQAGGQLGGARCWKPLSAAEAGPLTPQVQLAPHWQLEPQEQPWSDMVVEGWGGWCWLWCNV